MLYGIRKSGIQKNEVWGMKNGKFFDDDEDDRVGGIPLEIWRNPDTRWLDPANGIGNFPYVAFHMLDYQLGNHGPASMKDKTVRRKHIVEKMLYMIELDKGNVNTSFKIFEHLVPGSKPNICCADTLKMKDADLQRKFGVSKFHVVMGNPPFQNPNKSGDNKLYLEFVKFANSTLLESGVVVFIVPVAILEYMKLQKNRSYFDKKYNIIMINDTRDDLKSRYFKKVGSTFVHFIYQNDEEYDGTDLIKMSNNTKEIIRTDIFQSTMLSSVDKDIFEKIFADSVTYPFKTFKFLKKGRLSTQRIRKEQLLNGTVLKSESDTHKYKIIETINTSNPFPGVFHYYDKADVDMSRDKIVFSTKGYLMPTLDTTHEYTYADGFVYILCDEPTKCDSLVKLFKSPLMTYLTKKLKTSGFSDNTFFERLSKLKNVGIIRTNDDIYKALGIEDYKDYIEDVKKEPGSEWKARGASIKRTTRRKSRQK